MQIRFQIVRRFFPTAVLTALALAPPTPTSAQARTGADSAMMLNRAGLWIDAEQVATTYLADSSNATPSNRCSALISLTYSRLRQSRTELARSTLKEADHACAGFSEWTRELRALRQELARYVPLANSIRENDDWETGDPAALSLDTSALETHRRLCETTGADACLVVYHGLIVQEFYSKRYREPMYAMSSTKSITGLLVGMLIDDGRIANTKVTVCHFLADWCSGNRANVTIGHLLTMTSGLPRLRETGVGYVAKKDAYVRSLRPSATPGTTWAYSNEGVQLLSPILDRAAGEPIQLYALRRLFQPLGMNHTHLHLDPLGNAWTYADMETTPRDLARIGLLVLAGGEFSGQRIVSKKWIDSSLVASQPFNPLYGLLWWLHPQANTVAAHGYLETDLHVVRDMGLVVVRMQRAPVAGTNPDAYDRLAVPLYRTFVLPTQKQNQ